MKVAQLQSRLMKDKNKHIKSGTNSLSRMRASTYEDHCEDGLKKMSSSPVSRFLSVRVWTNKTETKKNRKSRTIHISLGNTRIFLYEFYLYLLLITFFFNDIQGKNCSCKFDGISDNRILIVLNLLPHSFSYNIREKNSRTQNAVDLVYLPFYGAQANFPICINKHLKTETCPPNNLVSVINLTVIALFCLYGLFSQFRHVTFPRELPSSFHNLCALMHFLSIKFRGKCFLGCYHVVCIGKTKFSSKCGLFS